MNHAYGAIDPLALFAASGHDLALFRSLSHIFLDTTPAMLARMQQAVLQEPGQSNVAFLSASHALRGVAMLVGARGLAALLVELEAQAKHAGCPTSAALEPVGTQLTEVCSEVLHSIGAFRGNVA
jgi:HPt (histidine-containing phosphotransfer) domain-containing protein